MNVEGTNVDVDGKVTKDDHREAEDGQQKNGMEEKAKVDKTPHKVRTRFITPTTKRVRKIYVLY